MAPPSDPSPRAAASLIALDWGTSNLRASLLGGGGALIDSRSAAAGVMSVQQRRFADALMSLCGDWIEQHGCPLIASGMIGSRQGWQEAAYLDCPAALSDAAGRLAVVEFGGGRLLHIVPGLICRGADGEADVMRGEETQLWGAGLAAGSCCVLPGTHSKWALVGENDRVETFQTWMTGELYALLTQHGILGRLIESGAFAATAFDDGVRLGLQRHGELPHTIFAARTAGLTGARRGDELGDFLSGILIGAELAGARRLLEGASEVGLLGDATLCERYARALGLAGIASRQVARDATTRGQWRLALAAGLLAKERQP